MFNSATGARVWWCVFAALIALECLPLWVFRYFPSQDGPSHLHNAVVTANYASEPSYREYYRLTFFQPGGNLLTHFLLTGLVKIAPAFIAEKILLTGYIALFALAFHWLLSALTEHSRYSSLFVFLLIPNLFFHLGFWNFCYGIALSLLMIGYFVRLRGAWTGRSIALLGLAGFVVYLSHAVSWAICATAVATLGFTDRREIKRYALLLASQIPPLGLFLWHSVLARADSSPCDAGGTLRSRLWSLYSLPFLDSTILPFDHLLERALAGAVVLALAAALWRRWRSSGFLALGGICTVLMVAAPGCVGSASLIRTRIGFYAFLFVIVWLGVQDWPKWFARLAGTACAVAAITMVAASFPVYAKWNDALSQFVAVGREIRPQSTVLLANMDASLAGISPYRHAAGLLSAHGLVDLGNYEAAIGYYFAVDFRPEVSPVPWLGTLEQLQSVPPVFDVARYEKQTRGRVDYILLRGSLPADPANLANYRLVAQHTDLRLYERTNTNSLQPIVPPQVASRVSVKPR
jgi:hypothetical protein